MIDVAGQPSTEAVLAQGGGSQNFLLPNGTFFFELILFVVVFILLAKFVVPPIRKAMEERAERVRTQERADLAAYMEKLFCDVLERSVRDSAAAEGQQYERLAAQPVVFARLAGFLAGHLSLGEDPLRRVLGVRR